MNDSFRYLHTYTYISLSLSLSIYIYIYIYINLSSQPTKGLRHNSKVWFVALRGWLDDAVLAGDRSNGATYVQTNL